MKKSCDGCKWKGWMSDNSREPYCPCDICSDFDQYDSGKIPQEIRMQIAEYQAMERKAKEMFEKLQKWFSENADEDDCELLGFGVQQEPDEAEQEESDDLGSEEAYYYVSYSGGHAVSAKSEEEACKIAMKDELKIEEVTAYLLDEDGNVL